MKKNVKKHTDGVWYYAVVRWDGYGVFTSWDRAREECDGYSDNKKKKFKTFEEAKAYAEDEYRKLHGVESSCYVEEIEWFDYFYRRMMKREFAEQSIPERIAKYFFLKIFDFICFTKHS